MTPIAQSVWAAVSAEPGEWSTLGLARDLDVSRREVCRAIEQLRETGRQVELRGSAKSLERLRRIDAARVLFASGKTYDQVAASFAGLDAWVVAEVLRAAKVEHSSAAERARVLVRAEPGVWSISELAARCGCTPRNVRIALGSAGLLGLRRVA